MTTCVVPALILRLVTGPASPSVDPPSSVWETRTSPESTYDANSPAIRIGFSPYAYRDGLPGTCLRAATPRVRRGGTYRRTDLSAAMHIVSRHVRRRRRGRISPCADRRQNRRATGAPNRPDDAQGH